jgi:small-conductance mechanosensitive channel
MTALDDWLARAAAYWRPELLGELGVLLLCVGLAWGLLRLVRPAQAKPGILFGERVVDGALLPLTLLLLALLMRWLLPHLGMPVALFALAVPVFLSLLVIRLAVQVLHTAYPSSALVRALERTISWGVWLATILWLTGLLPLILAEMHAISWQIGGAQVSLRDLVEGALAAAAILVGLVWLSAVVEARLMAASTVHLSVRKIAANATRAGLLLVGLLVALSAAGIPLGALGVMGGAVGVGIGLGLQKLAANYVSGFVILAERSLRIGDIVAVDGFEGAISDITTRYTVIRSPTGREAIVPNETLITQRVDNLTYADSRLVLTTKVQVAYGTDLDTLFPKILAAVRQLPRVLADPGPGVRLSMFADSGLELTVAFWISDPDNGQVNLVGDVNMALLRLFNAEGIEIPFPQRVVHGLPHAVPVPAQDLPAPSPVAPPAVPLA